MMGGGEMMQWVFAGLVLATFLALGVIYMMYFWPGAGSRRSNAPKRDMRMTWKVVKIGEPVLEGMGLVGKIEYGVIISTDEMLAQTQTLLFCPLFEGIDKSTQTALAILPWHVEVDVRQEPDRHLAEVGLARKYVSTKIVLPIGSNEIDMDGLERGYLDDHSRVAVARKLALWMPCFAKIAHL
jgi:hypothetical protein